MDNSKWFPYLKPTSEHKFRIFCFHHSGAGASVFRKWLTFFSKNIDIVPVQLPGREGRFSEPFISRIDPLIEQLLPAILNLCDLPFAVFGHSLGGLLAYIVTLELEKYKLFPKHLYVSACLPPHEIQKRTPIYDLNDKKFLKVIESYRGLPSAILKNTDMLKLLLPRFRSDFELFESSTNFVDTSVNTPINVYYGSQDTVVPEKKIKTWDGYTTNSCIYKKYPGDHFFYQSLQEQVCQAIESNLNLGALI